MEYYAKNKYFQKQINNYFKNYKWTFNKNTKNLQDIDYFNKNKCTTCKFVSQIKNINNLGNKKLQYYSLITYLKHRPKYLPKTIAFSIKNYNKLYNLFNNNKLWIIKPENDSFRNGVKIINSYNQLESWINKYKYKNWIIQNFIDNPLLYNNHKFHLRIYAIIINSKKSYNVFVYKNGFIYLASHLYNNNDLLDLKSNLTGEGSKEQVKLFPEDFINKFKKNKYIQIKNQINKIIYDSVMSVKNKLKCYNKTVDSKCYKLIGYDILIDNKFNAHLLEINTRLITFKYPPNYFKQNMYNNILNLVLFNKKNNFTHIVNINYTNLNKNKNYFNIIEGFNINFYNSNSYLINGIIILLILIILFNSKL